MRVMDGGIREECKVSSSEREGGGIGVEKGGGEKERERERGRGVYCSSTRKGSILVICDHL